MVPGLRMLAVFSALGTSKILLARWLALEDASILRALVLEAPPVVLLFAVAFTVFERRRFAALMLGNLFLSLLIASMSLYAAYYGRMPVPQALIFLPQLGAVRESVIELVSPVYLLFFADLPLLYAWYRTRTSPEPSPPQSRKTAAAVAGIAFVVFAVHVGLGLADDDAARTFAARTRGIVALQVIDGTGELRRASGEIDLADAHAVQARIRSLKNALPEPPTAPLMYGAASGRHVIVVIFESLQEFAVGARVESSRVTPTLERLRADALYFPNIYFQIGPGNTSDAEHIIHTSLYPFELQAVSAAVGDRAIPSLPRILSERGYTSLTVHANDVGFWNRDALYPALGFDAVYGIGDFETAGLADDVIGMGPSDEALFELTARVIDERARAGERLYVSALTLTSHTPFEMPESKRPLGLSLDIEGTLLVNYLESIAYSDRALGRFIDALDEQGLYEDSIIVIVGDHFGPQYGTMTPAEQNALDEMLGRPYEWADRLAVPMLIIAPGIIAGDVVEVPGGHVDVMPTLANLLGVSLDSHVHFGQDLLNPTGQLLGIRYYEPLGTYIDDAVVVRPTGVGDTAADAWDSRSREPATLPPVGRRADTTRRVIELQHLSDEYLRSLPTR